jgi:hypothetical protein
MQARFCSGRLLRRAFLAVALATTTAGAQTASKSAVKKASAHRANEMTLAGMRPGRDSIARAAELNKHFRIGKEYQGSEKTWLDGCRHLSLSIDSGDRKTVAVIRAADWSESKTECAAPAPSPWKTGRGLRVWDATSRVLKLYGEPDSRSPSTKDGQPLELWYYAFDWAGADVPQVMEVLCTKETDGKPGHVVEITLAGPSL